MSLVTGSYTSRGERAQREFDTLLGVDSIEWPLAREDRSATAPSAIELLLESEPAVPRASLLTVVGLFITLAIAQVVIMSLVVANFDLAGIRLALIYVFGAPALLYAIVAAWDQRQLIASGHVNAAPWGWAVAFPPVYLILRWLRVHEGSYGPVRAVLAWTLVQLGVTATLVVLVILGILAAPGTPAGAVGGTQLSPAKTATLLTASGIEEDIERQWSETGSSGMANCPEVVSIDAGAELSCTATLEGTPIAFTVTMVEHAPGAYPWQVTRWGSAS